MNRRSILGMLGIGAAAGPALVNQYASDSVNKIPSVGYLDKAELAIPWNPVEQLADAKREYEILTSDPAKWIADYVLRDWEEYINGYTSYRYETIDPDIRNMKSLSETTKWRIFFERKAKRKYHQYKTTVIGRIQQIMKEM